MVNPHRSYPQRQERLGFYWTTQAAPGTLGRRLMISKKGYIGLVQAAA